MGDHFQGALFSGVLRGVDGKHSGDATVTGNLEHEGSGGGPAQTNGNPALEWGYIGVLYGIQD